MKQLFTLFLTALLAGGCATGLGVPNAPDQADQADQADKTEKSSTATRLVRFQNLALDPRNGGQLIATGTLLPGDILLSATNGITSAGIRLLTLAPVSHAALYVGQDQIVEAVGTGVRNRPIAEVIAEEDVIVVFRHPNLLREHGEKIRGFALQKVGRPYDHLGIMLQAPFTLERRICELPLVPEIIRNACLQGIATIQLGTPSNDRFFCSQLVLEAYRQAGLPLTAADPRWISPADILHMREGDVPSMSIHQPLAYVGHLKFSSVSTVAQAQ